MTYRTTVIFRWEMTRRAMRIRATAELTAMGSRLILLMAFYTGIFFMTGRTLVTIPRSLEAVCFTLPGDGVVRRRLGLMATVA